MDQDDPAVLQQTVPEPHTEWTHSHVSEERGREKEERKGGGEEGEGRGAEGEEGRGAQVKI